MDHRAHRNEAGFVGKWKFLGTDDSINVCERCGRKNLKHTIALEDSEGFIVHYGSECAADALAIPEAAVGVLVRDADRANREAEEAEEARRRKDDAARRVELAEFEAWLRRKVPEARDALAARQALGGHLTAWARWKVESSGTGNGHWALDMPR